MAERGQHEQAENGAQQGKGRAGLAHAARQQHHGDAPAGHADLQQAGQRLAVGSIMPADQGDQAGHRIDIGPDAAQPDQATEFPARQDDDHRHQAGQRRRGCQEQDRQDQQQQAYGGDDTGKKHALRDSGEKMENGFRRCRKGRVVPPLARWYGRSGARAAGTRQMPCRALRR